MKGMRNLDISWEDLYIPPSYSKNIYLKRFAAAVHLDLLQYIHHFHGISLDSYVKYEEHELVEVWKDNTPFECRAHLEKLEIIKFVQPFQKAQKMIHSIRPYSKKA